ncbi:hypothetical protein [Methanobacterium spitsbergense]|uniref:Uncharacterized protein n=1 Tax=Methanobacterium spitsbergense TaxID=2874285 RepID=A0A8T5V0K4_9EURY|nr:hypothetical protein [Methanobacterium spitsbergense]MBZ2166980.1 hypothetical protein [Methanobacterium spitsbergense]
MSVHKYEVLKLKRSKQPRFTKEQQEAILVIMTISLAFIAFIVFSFMLITPAFTGG